jgi:hypothetical protein
MPIQYRPTKEKAMQKMLKRFMLIGALPLFFSPVTALSQQKGEMADLADIDWTQMKMTQEDAEGMAKMVFHEDIRAGRITVKQAGEYFKCVEEDYAVKFKESPEGEKYREAMKRMKQYENMNASEKAKQDADMKASVKAMEKLREQSGDKCVKQLGLQTKPGQSPKNPKK